MGEFHLAQNPKLHEITPLEYDNVRVQGDFEVIENGALQSLDAFAIAEVDGHIWILDNPTLPTCDADAFVAGISAVSGPVVIRGNDDAGYCP